LAARPERTCRLIREWQSAQNDVAVLLVGALAVFVVESSPEAESTDARARAYTIDAGHVSLVTQPYVVSKLIEAAVDAT
jgi:hypothetical protein